MLTQSDVVFTTDKFDNQVKGDVLGDEELAFLATNCECPAARQELLLRFYDWSNHLIARLARRYGLAPHDVEDAQQDAVFGIIKAIQRFDPFRVCKGDRACFQSFLHRILSDRFKDFVKHLRQRTAHDARPTRSASESDSRVKVCCPEEWADPERMNDPAVMAESNEFQVLFWKAVEHLNGVEHSLAFALLSGGRLRKISNELAISYDAVKRLRRRLRKRLGMLQRLIA
jgi:RNA polymerase sigma factor (sigma-70 family)